MPSQSRHDSRVPRVVIAGGGVAGLETLLALRALAADRVKVTILAPESIFTNLSMSVEQPFKPKRGRGVRLRGIAAEMGAQWHRGVLDRVEAERHRVVTRDGDGLPYDILVLAVGARPYREWASAEVLTYHGGRDGPAFRLLLHQLLVGQISRVAFVKPGGASWPLPLYDLALMTAAACAEHGRSPAQLTLITPEQEPLAIFGKPASTKVRQLLQDAGITLHTSGYGAPTRSGWLEITPGGQRLRADRVVTQPRLVGPRLRGIACAEDGFIQTDAHGRLPGLDRVFAAGDATTFPVKQGGLAAQQADAVAEMIAACVGVEIDPQPFRPVLRGVLFTGAAPRYVRADISGATGDDSIISGRALWWPPDKICGRYLAPYLSSQAGEALDVMPQDEHALPVESTLDHLVTGTSGLRELADVAPPGATERALPQSEHRSLAGADPNDGSSRQRRRENT